MNSNSKSKIGHVLQCMTIVPLLVLGMITVLLSYFWFTRTMQGEVELELQTVCRNLDTLLDTAYPGDYELVGDNTFRLYKGDADITEEYSLVDNLKADTDWELTLFYEDTRILTTILDTDGKRLVGTAAPEQVVQEVLGKGEPEFYTNVFIYNSSYFSYYEPLTNSDGSVVGMLFVGKPSLAVRKAVQQSLYPLLAATLIVVLIMVIVLFFYARKIVRVLLRIRSFLADVATGDLTARLDPAVAGRGDEIGDIGRSAVAMQHSLRVMVEQDALTGLYNRRFGDRKLKQSVNKYQNCNTPFSVAIGDIDFFKKVNDTYGHDCGDAVLKSVAEKLLDHMRSKGYVARWGGEEFLLVFENMELPDAYRALEDLLNDIRAMEVSYDDLTVKVTMTFGMTAADTVNITELLRHADERLYVGKKSGRNRIIMEDIKEETSPVETSPVEIPTEDA